MGEGHEWLPVSFRPPKSGGRFWRILDAEERAIIRRQLPNGANVLEVGAGTGRITGTLLDVASRVTAVDISEKMLTELGNKFRGSDRLETFAADVHRLDSVPGYGEYDAVVSLRMLPHYNPPIA